MQPSTWFKKTPVDGTKAPAYPATVPAADLQVDTSVVSLERAIFGQFGTGFPRQNLDSLIGRKGPKIYAEMRLDEQVKAAVTFKRDAILSRGWTFEFDGESKLPELEQKKRKRVFEQIVKKLPGSFIDALNKISVGREYGFSLTEKIYQQITCDGASYVGLRKLAGRDPVSFNFFVDPYGDLIKCEQESAGKKININIAKFIHYVHNPEFDEYFGRSDLREAYRSWYFKDMMIRFWGLYMEKLGGGMVIASIKPEANIQSTSPQYTQLQTAVSQMKASASILLPVGVEVNVVFPTTSDAFEKACTWHDLAIAKALLVPNLAGVSHTGQTGSFSQAQSQIEAFAWTLKADTERLQACVDEQLFRDLGIQNWGDDEYPCFTFKPLSGEQLRWIVDTWLKMVTGGAVIATEIDEARIREILEMPPRDAGAKPLIDPTVPQGQEHESGMKDKDHELGERAKDAEVERGMEAERARAADPVLSAKDAAENKAKAAALAKKNFSLDESKHPRTNDGPMAKAKMSLVPTLRDARLTIASARERCDFAVIDRRQATLAQQLTTDTALAVARATKKLLGTDEELKALTDADTSDIANAVLDSMAVGRLKATYHKALLEAWALGRQHAQSEVRKTRHQYARDARHFADIRDKAAAYFESNSFKLAGDVSDRARSIIQQELLNSVKVGRSPGQTRTAIWERLIAKGLSTPEAARLTETDAGVNSALDDLWKDTAEEAAAYLDTVARTNLFGAMNEARYAEFSDPALGDFVMALRYSAILDDRTTDICQALDDVVFKTDSETWNTFRPPNHFNCRSLLVPITALDVEDGVWDGVESEEPTVEPQAGFK